MQAARARLRLGCGLGLRRRRVLDSGFQWAGRLHTGRHAGMPVLHYDSLTLRGAIVTNILAMAQ
jgi:hypothetical protein